MPETEWHLDKRVPVALIFGLLVQTGGVFWWASSVESRMGHVEQRTVEAQTSAAENTRAVRSLEMNAAAIGERLRSIEAATGETRSDVAEILRYLRSISIPGRNVP